MVLWDELNEKNDLEGGGKKGKGGRKKARIRGIGSRSLVCSVSQSRALIMTQGDDCRREEGKKQAKVWDQCLKGRRREPKGVIQIEVHINPSQDCPRKGIPKRQGMNKDGWKKKRGAASRQAITNSLQVLVPKKKYKGIDVRLDEKESAGRVKNKYSKVGDSRLRHEDPPRGK